MKKIIYTAVLLFGIGFVVASCQREDVEQSNYASAIIGKWRELYYEEYKDGKLNEKEVFEGDEVYFLQFMESGLVAEIGLDWDGSEVMDVMLYELDKDQLTFIEGNYKTYCKIIELTKNKLVLYEDDEEDGCEVYDYFERAE